MGVPTVMALSGGMDSTCLMLRLLREGHPVTAFGFEYGQRHRLELDRAATNVELLRGRGHDLTFHSIDLRSAMGSLNSALTDQTLDMPMGHYEEEDMRQTVVPNRNAVFSSLLYAKALSLASTNDGQAHVALGVHSGDHAIYPDCRPAFYDALGRAFQIGNWDADGVQFVLPYLHLDKAGILLDGLQSCQTLNLDFDQIMANTLTSYQPDEEGRSAGTTGSDVERILAFHDIGRIDPLEYISPWDDVVAHALALREQHEEGEA